MYLPRKVKSMGLVASGFGVMAIAILLPDYIENIRTGSISVVEGIWVFLLWLACIVSFVLIILSKPSASKRGSQLEGKIATVAVKPMFIQSEEGNLLSELQTLSGHKPIACTYLGGSGIAVKENSEVLLVRLSDSLVVIASGSVEKHVIPFSRLSALEISGPGTEITDAGMSGGGFGVEGLLKGVLVAATINALTKRSTTNTFLRVLSTDAEAYFHTSVIEPSQLKILLSPAVVAIEAHKNRRGSSNAGDKSIAIEISRLNEMLKEGVIDVEEFALAKKRVLKITE